MMMITSHCSLVHVCLLLMMLPAQSVHEGGAEREPSLVASVRVLGVEQWVSLQGDGALSIQVPTLEMESGSQELDAELSIMLICDHEKNREHCRQTSAGLDQAKIVRIWDNEVLRGTCESLPCSVTLRDVAAASHHIVATAHGFGLLAKQCEMNFSVSLDPNPRSWQGLTEVHNKQHEPQNLGSADSTGNPMPQDDIGYVAILFPPDDFCMNDAQHAYVSVAVSDGFFTLPEARHVGAKLDIQTMCFSLDGHTAQPATMAYDSRVHGPLFVCDTQHAHVEMKDGFAMQMDADAKASLAGQHDCPAGGCKHDLDEGYMMDVFLLAPQLVSGMHRARFYLVGPDGSEVGGEAFTTYFVDHGSGAACSSRSSPSSSSSSSSPSSSSSSLNPASAERERGSADAAHMEHEQSVSGEERRARSDADVGSGERRLLNVARGKEASQSSTAGGAAAAAVDGKVLAWCDAEWSQRCVHVAKTELELSPFWEVDLGAEWTVEEVVVWGELLSQGASGYPALVVGAPLSPFSVMLLDENREVTGELIVDEGEPREVHWLSNLSAIPPSRFLRIALLPPSQSGGSGSEVGRQLALREVQVMSLSTARGARDCGRGRWAAERGECVCESGWFGAGCEANMLLSTMYLPPPSRPPRCHACVFEGCERADASVESSLFDATLDKLRALQHPHAPCQRGEAVSFFFENRGLAATVMHIAGLMTYSWMQSRPLVISNKLPWIYTDAAACPAQAFECYFKPWSACQTGAEGSFLAGGRDNLVRDFNWVVPPELEHKGVFWWRALTLAYLWQLQEEVLQELAVEEVKARIGFEHPIISMHVRRGDACHTSLRQGRCLSLLENLAGVRAVAQRYDIPRVFVATDSPTVVDELRELAPELSFVSIDNFDRTSLEESILECQRQHPEKRDDGTTLDDGCTGNDAWLEHRLGKGQVGRKELAMATLLDLTLMSHADAFVGHFASNLSRMAYLLAVAHHRRMIPFWSVDGPWCYHWRMCCDVKLDGSSSVC